MRQIIWNFNDFMYILQHITIKPHAYDARRT